MLNLFKAGKEKEMQGEATAWWEAEKLYWGERGKNGTGKCWSGQ